jgi:ribosomal protein S18 acetylase RimI-like enzyme
MQIELKRLVDFPELETIRELYIAAFPPEERREFDQLKLLLNNEECHFYRIFTLPGTLAGFCILWEFPAFVFIEHFAVKPELRGLGIGEKTLDKIKGRFQKIIILETELPTDELKIRRIRFYERNGYHKLNRTYFQPSYGENKSEVELKLMSTNVDIQTEELCFIIKTIRKKVYNID